jgi:hypothetical protein
VLIASTNALETPRPERNVPVTTRIKALTISVEDEVGMEQELT